MQIMYDEMFAKLTQSESDLAAASLRITDFELSSKIMKGIVKRHIHGKLKHGLGYSEVPPPYNSNYTIMPDSLTGASTNTDMIVYESSSASPVLAKSGSNAITSTNISLDVRSITSSSSLDHSQKSVDVPSVPVSDRVSSVSLPRTPASLKHFKSGGFMGDENKAVESPTSSHSTDDHLSDSDSEQQRYQKEFENLMLTSHCQELSSTTLPATTTQGLESTSEAPVAAKKKRRRTRRSKAKKPADPVETVAAPAIEEVLPSKPVETTPIAAKPTLTSKSSDSPRRACEICNSIFHSTRMCFDYEVVDLLDLDYEDSPSHPPASVSVRGKSAQPVVQPALHTTNSQFSRFRQTQFDNYGFEAYHHPRPRAYMGYSNPRSFGQPSNYRRPPQKPFTPNVYHGGYARGYTGYQPNRPIPHTPQEYYTPIVPPSPIPPFFIPKVETSPLRTQQISTPRPSITTTAASSSSASTVALKNKSEKKSAAASSFTTSKPDDVPTGTLRKMTYIGDNGELKTIMAWVPFTD